MSQLHQSNGQQETGKSVLIGNLNRGVQGNGLPWATLLGTPPLIGTALEEDQMGKVPHANLQCTVTCFLYISTRQSPTTMDLHKTLTSSIGLHKLKIGIYQH